MKGKAIVPLVLGLCIGLVAVKFGVDAIKSAKASSGTTKTVGVVRAVEDIDIGTEMTAEMLELVQATPGPLIPANDRSTNVEDVVGRVAGKAIPQGAAVLLSMLAPEGTSPGMPGLIEPGFRAFSVKVDEVTSVAFQVKRNDWVDVIVVMNIKSARGKTETIAEVILQHIEVVAVGRSITPKSPDGKTKGRSAKSVTLLVPEQEVPRLHLAATRGKLTLALRGDDKLTRPEGAFAMLNGLLGAAREGQVEQEPQEGIVPQPVQIVAMTAVQPDPPHMIAIYRGSPSLAGFMIESVVFENAGSRKIVNIVDGLRGVAASASRSGQGTRSPSGSNGNWQGRQPDVSGPGKASDYDEEASDSDEE